MNKMHFENITVDSLMEFRANAFMIYAYCTNGKDMVCLGVNSLGQFVVKTNSKTIAINNPFIAIETYIDLATKQ